MTPANAPQIALVLLVDATGAVLLQLRDGRTRVAPNMWALPGGHVEPDEDPLHAAQRELLEEAGIHAQDLRRFWKGVRYVPGAGVRRWHVFWGSTEATQRDVVVGEGKSMVFIPADRVSRLELTPNARFILSAFLASAAYRSTTHP
jgi:8-oxo-dGTP pyrophosphatase MutT (NUDIX family)